MNPNFSKDFNRIVKKYVAGNASAEEIEFIERYYHHLDKNPDVFVQVEQEELGQLADQNFKAIQLQIEKSNHRPFPFYRLAAAAAVLLFIAIGYYFIPKRASKNQAEVALGKSIDVMPGVDQAVLTLANGTKVVLGSQNTEQMIQQTGLVVSKTKQGQLIYTAIGTGDDTKKIGYNTIQTAKGNQYQVILPDGTHAWLNAASSLKFPELFKGATRTVELTGEGYFEVSKDSAHPFIVRTVVNNVSQEIKVLGTHFNVNAYWDEAKIKTTLVEGSILINNQHIAKKLMPGQQSLLDANSIDLIQIDTDDETAWKDGLFRFNNSNLTNIMSQLERWYDIQVDYTQLPNKRFNGMVPRKAKLSEVLKMLSLTGNIQFAIQPDKKLTVIKQ